MAFIAGLVVGLIVGPAIVFAFFAYRLGAAVEYVDGVNAQLRAP